MFLGWATWTYVNGKLVPNVLPMMVTEARSLNLSPRLMDDLWDATVEEAYRRRARQLWDYARRLGLDAGRSEEVAQEAFVRLLALRPLSRPQAADAWLFRTVHNLAVDQHRRLARTTASEITRLAELAPASDERLAVWEQVDRLPERQRAAIYLRYRADFEFSTIAEILGISQSGARANVFRALARLREWMAVR